MFLSAAWVALACAGCHGTPAPTPLTPQTSGEIAVAGLTAPVRIVRDTWGIPHIYAQSQGDLFVAQGFVQAEDRLFQMDLWKRAAEGRLSEVLGANFVERDAMTRRFQYRGDMSVEWASYGPDAKAIADAFARGINAWVALARERPPEEFVLAGWLPDFWSADDLVNRTDAFVDSGDALQDVRRLHLSDIVADQIRRVGTRPFFAALAAPARMGPAPNAAGQAERDVDPASLRPIAIGRVAVERGRPLTFSEGHDLFDHPSTRYVVHLHAPGWNVIGATRPWLPGVAAGHNERVAWGMAALDANTQDVYVDDADSGQGAGGTIVKEPIAIKGRPKPFVFDIDINTHGVVVAADRERHQVFRVRWSGTEPGAAAELASIAIDRALNWKAFRDAAARWKMPARRVVYADADGNIGFQDAALVPVRRREEWRGWQNAADLQHAFNPPGGLVAEDPKRASVASTATSVEFVHPLAVTAASRQRFNIGPMARPTPDDSPVRAELDPRDWDRSRGINAPGQSEYVDGGHFRDLATLWSGGGWMPLAFSDTAVQRYAQATLMLVPKR
ncbi:MAG TPA: penicillin acylase family protein [Vicinamibacterales bacterium]